MPNNLQINSKRVGGLFLLVLGGWVLHSFLVSLVWAVVLAISTWPVYQRLLASNELHGKMTWVAWGLTLLMGAIIIAPLGYGFSRLMQETEALRQLLSDAQRFGVPAPPWLETFPIVAPATSLTKMERRVATKKEKIKVKSRRHERERNKK